MIQLISWNIQQGGGQRLRAQVDALKDLKPDLLTLQEVTTTSGPVYRGALATLGLPHVVDSFQLAPDPHLLVGPRRYGQLIASRWPLTPLPPADFAVPWPERVLSCLVELPAGPVELHTTHIPPGSSNGWLKIEMLEGVFARLARSSAVPRILCGDFNTPQAELADGRIITWGQEEDDHGNYVLWGRWHGGSGERWDAAERNVLTALASFDLMDVYRTLHGVTLQEYSHYVRIKARSIGRRFDHVFASRALGPVACRYLHDLREQGLSDHAPLLVVFKPKVARFSSAI